MHPFIVRKPGFVQEVVSIYLTSLAASKLIRSIHPVHSYSAGVQQGHCLSHSTRYAAAYTISSGILRNEDGEIIYTLLSGISSHACLGRIERSPSPLCVCQDVQVNTSLTSAGLSMAYVSFQSSQVLQLYRGVPAADCQPNSPASCPSSHCSMH